jgi:hypothetical protein
MASSEVGASFRIDKAARLKIFLVLFASFLTMIAATAVSAGYGIHRYWENILRQEITRNLTEKARMFASRVNTDRSHKIDDITSEEGQSAGARATVVDFSGRVIADSEFAVASLENEGRRPEFVTASRGEVGVETRKRNGIPVIYVAVPAAGVAVRLAYPLADIAIATAHSRQIIILGSIIALLAGLAISAMTADTLTRNKAGT